ncbi:DEAD/DEAH box helicase [Mesorhizobium humile]|uniref:DEAD/DEAH box helicase n=1 Tax=Mesorhizobium humile TaxID=3072313 RepID=A0ABU4YD50_9HYPH|nr:MULTISPECIES: DEAD/DEAH box helicase [unclassified Mesorhizobium]MDX8458390.1 DEAD/DEAH box helicase [Mesorhizobium sp. VK2D]MDX8483802.1 DEAD/DEAH box helicase [Mesorhizobium sp. VK2B]
MDASVEPLSINVSWPDALTLIREFGTKAFQTSLGFRFVPQGEAVERIREFSDGFRKARASQGALKKEIDREEIQRRLSAAGFTRRTLKDFQFRDLENLLALPNGANFSVPGAGKTTVTFALHVLTRSPDSHIIIISPKSAFPAWRAVVEECMEPGAPNGGDEPFKVLDSRFDIDKELRSGSTRFLISYDLAVRQQSVLTAYMARNSVHLVLDESHRMKAGLASQRGAFLLSAATLPVRRDILSGTPMPQAASDLASQLGFLWPGHGYDLSIQRGQAPRDVLGNLYVRTTKTELGLPPAERHFYDVEMAPGQLALYSVVRSEALRQFTKVVSSGRIGQEFIKARKSVMRLLQLSVNPSLAVTGMSNDGNISSGIVDQVLEEGTSAKILAVADHARRLASEGYKTVIWTIFTDTIRELVTTLADLNPVFIHGGVQTGEETDPDTREGKLARFHNDPRCFVLVANPAAAGEGISLHTVCHNAIYADRSYVSTHYLQSIDRIHRLGLPADQETHIHIYRTRAPAQVGSIDLSVSRRLAQKIRGLEQTLGDPDLHLLAYDEENADDPIDYSVELQDLVDLVAELEGNADSTSEEA